MIINNRPMEVSITIFIGFLGLVGKCTFEFNFCQWSQDTNDDFDFERQMGDTGTPSTGPQSDFSNGIGRPIFESIRVNHFLLYQIK